MTRKLLYMQLYIFHKTEIDLQHACLQIISVSKDEFQIWLPGDFQDQEGVCIMPRMHIMQP